MSTVLLQEFSGVWMVPLHCPVQRCPALRINGVDLCLSSRFEEKRDHGNVTVLRCHVKSGKAILGHRINVSAFIEKICRNILVFLTDCVMEVPIR
jgi:hypothetical protein